VLEDLLTVTGLRRRSHLVEDDVVLTAWSV